MSPVIYTRAIETPLGTMTAAAEKDALTGLWFEGQRYYPCGTESWTKAELPIFRAAAEWLAEYFAGRPPRLLPALRPRGTEFQKKVWSLLLKIPYGGTTTYGALAERMAADRGLSRFSARAVGGAVGRNPISILIPCHRVVASDGGLTGYAGGLSRKAALLRLEGTL